VAALSVAALAGCADGTAPGGAEAPPNIVLLISDDQDWRELGFMGTDAVRTPHLDRLARQGTVFSQAHLPMSRCRPTLASFVTGQWPHASGLYYAYGSGRLDAAHPLPALLRDAGYATFVGGKWWEGDAAAAGFTDGDGNGSNTFVRRDQDDALEFVARHAGRRPMFLWWAPKIPHLPHDPPRELAAAFESADVTVPPWVGERDRGSYVEYERASWAMEAWLDRAAGELLHAFAEHGLLESTVFVFLIDNGWTNGLPSKGTPYENGVRTPVVVTGAGRVAAGRLLDGLTSTLDLFPTLLDLAGVPVPEGAGGRSWAAALRPGEAAGADAPAADAGTAAADSSWRRETLCGAIYPGFASEGNRPQADVYALYAREGDWKYVLWLQDLEHSENQDRLRIPVPAHDFPERRAGSEELYHLGADPAELRNRAAEPELAGRVERMRGQALEWWTGTGGKPLEGEPGRTLRRMGLGRYAAERKSG
jgi:uncharacterized sulfatase